MHFRPNDHAPPPRLVRAQHAGVAVNRPTRRKIGGRDVLDEVGNFDVVVVDVGNDAVDDFAQVVGRDFCRHPDGDAVGAVDEQVRHGGRQHDGLLQRTVEILLKIDGIFVDVAEHLFGEARHAGLGIPHRRRRIPVDRPEVALPVDERIAHGKILRHAHHGIVNGRITMGMVFAQHFADDTGAFLVRTARRQAQLAHPVQHAPVDGLQPVAHIGQRPAHDHRHRIVDVRGLHLVLDTDGDDSVEFRLHIRMRGGSEAAGRTFYAPNVLNGRARGRRDEPFAIAVDANTRGSWPAEAPRREICS